METQKGRILGKYLANVQLDVSIAAYTKVPITWNEERYTTDFNKFFALVYNYTYLIYF